MTLEGYTQFDFEHDGTSRTVYRRGTGPGVVVIHEIPGITPQVERFARIVADAGFTVFLPNLLGNPGQPMSGGYILQEAARACISREFRVLACNESSPIVELLKALCRQVHAELGGKGVGAIGMCFTGNFALSMMVEPSVLAPVLAQPSLPFSISRKRTQALHISPSDLQIVKNRVKNEGLSVLGLRFTEDRACRPERFNRLRSELGEGFEAIEIDSSRGNAYGIPTSAHSVVTTELVDREGHPTRIALDRVLAFFIERLKERAP